LTFAALAEHREFLEGLVAASGALAALGYILIYAALTAMSVPGAMLMTLAGGLLFGPWLGALYALTAATLGATAVFLAARNGLYGLAARIGTLAERLRFAARRDAADFAWPLVIAGLLERLRFMCMHQRVLIPVDGIAPPP